MRRHKKTNNKISLEELATETSSGQVGYWNYFQKVYFLSGANNQNSCWTLKIQDMKVYLFINWVFKKNNNCNLKSNNFF